MFFSRAMRPTVAAELLAAAPPPEPAAAAAAASSPAAGRSVGPASTEVAKALGVRWKALSEEDKAPYLSLAAEDKARYQRELAAMVEPVAEEGAAEVGAAAGQENKAQDDDEEDDDDDDDVGEAEVQAMRRLAQVRRTIAAGVWFAFFQERQRQPSCGQGPPAVLPAMLPSTGAASASGGSSSRGGGGGRRRRPAAVEEEPSWSHHSRGASNHTAVPWRSFCPLA